MGQKSVPAWMKRELLLFPCRVISKYYWYGTSYANLSWEVELNAQLNAISVDVKGGVSHSYGACEGKLVHTIKWVFSI